MLSLVFSQDLVIRQNARLLLPGYPTLHGYKYPVSSKYWHGLNVPELLSDVSPVLASGWHGYDACHEQYGPHTSDYHSWLRKFKKTFDPNGASESTNYITAGDWPLR